MIVFLHFPVVLIGMNINVGQFSLAELKNFIFFMNTNPSHTLGFLHNTEGSCASVNLFDRAAISPVQPGEN